MGEYNLFEGYDDVEESHGFDTEPLPTAWYHLLLEKVLGTDATKNGAVQARCQVLVASGELQGKRTFINVLMGPSMVNKDKTQRSAAELNKAKGNIQGQMKGFMTSIGCNTGEPTGESDVEKASSFYNVGMWDGRQFIGNIKHRAATGMYSASNQLNGFHNIDDAKRGLEWLRAKDGGGNSQEAQTV